MALIICSECGRQISDKAVSCPNCGCPLSEIENAEPNKGTPVNKLDNAIHSKKIDKSTKVKNDSSGCLQLIIASVFIILGAVMISSAKRTFNLLLLILGMIVVILGMFLLYASKK